MLKYIVLSLLFVVSFFVIQTSIQVGLGIYITNKYVPDTINAYEKSKEEQLQSKVEFGSVSSLSSYRNVIVWLLSFGLSSAVVFLVFRYGFLDRKYSG